ncbi:MAG: double zinc ribbon domain-containing protein [Desulforhopalus sp.]
MLQVLTHCLDLLFPSCCVACLQRLGPRSGSIFCDRCHAKISYLQPPVCRVCGMQLDCQPLGNPLCGACLKSPPPFSIARSLVWYEATVRDLLLRLKFGQDTSVLPGLKEIVSLFDGRIFSDVDMIIPVPLHRARLRSRGLNQAVVLSRLFFQNRSKHLRTDLLIRAKRTQPQTRMNGAERRKNLRNVFEVRPAAGMEGATVCLVDDVYTTGTTVRECSKIMLKSGAAEVRVLTLARVRLGRRE